MLEQIRSLLKAALDERSEADTKIQTILDAVETDERTDLTEDETKAFDEARSALKQIDDRIAELRTREADLVELAEQREEAKKAMTAVTRNAPADIKVGAEERTYRPDGEHDFLADAFRAKLDGDIEARQRLERARDEALVDYRSTTGNFGGLVVPQYLTSQYAATLKSGRPFLENVNRMPLPERGMTLTIPRGATPTTAAAQETQNTAVTNQTMTISDLVVPVRTFSGQQLVSRQAVDRGDGIGGIILADLYGEYATKVNISAIAGDGTAGGHWGILNTTSVQTAAWTGTTGASLVSSIHNALGKINGSRYAAATRVFMHPRRWAWLCAQSDTAGRPLVQINGYDGSNIIGDGSAAGYGVVGSVAGVPVVTDAGIPIGLGASTDEDRIIVTRASDVLFMEDAQAPVGLTLNEVGASNLSVSMVVYGYSAFTAGRYPVATCNLQGTGFKQVLT